LPFGHGSPVVSLGLFRRAPKSIKLDLVCAIEFPSLSGELRFLLDQPLLFGTVPCLGICQRFLGAVEVRPVRSRRNLLRP
jgi:hypothetical protein